jgi:hypothetical protein
MFIGPRKFVITKGLLISVQFFMAGVDKGPQFTPKSEIKL